MQALKDICRLYEFEVELLQPWHARVFYYEEPIFDFYPKNKRLFDLREKNLKRAWHTLGSNWKKQIHSILEVYIFTEELIVK